MIDIVERLRFKAGTHVPVVDTMAEAATEIEQLRLACDCHPESICANNKRLHEQLASLQASSGYEASIAQVELERLQALIKATGDAIEKLAFEIPPPNTYTPRLVMLANAMRAALEPKPCTDYTP